jgi:hypothetical protein
VRAREFITEAKAPQGTRTDASKEFERAHPGMVMPGGRGDVYWGRYYDFYRVASLAGMDPKDIDAVDEVSFFGNLPVFSAYTENDREKLKAIMKKLRMKPTDGVSNGSKEIEEVNVTSPVKSFRGYPR